MKVLSSLILISLICEAQNAKILGIFPATSRSHYIISSALMSALSEKGHNVTMISPYEQQNPKQNEAFRDIVLTGWSKIKQEYTGEENFFDYNGSLILNEFFMNYVYLLLTEEFLKHQNVQRLINSNKTFDIVIVEQYGNEAVNGLASHFNASLIAFSTLATNDRVNLLTANPSPVSYIPEFYLDYSSDMTFFQRLFNTFLRCSMELYKHFYLLPKQERILKKYLPNAPNIYNVLHNSSLVLVNSHPSFSQAVPLVPNMIEIGGCHVKPPKQLPKDLREFLDSAKDGAIYFSMGSSAKSTEFPLKKREAFLNTFSKLKEKVLWKWEDEKLPGKTDNVKIGKWLPQQDILAHPNVKLFITHGGLLSTIETVYHGVPTLTIPIIADQKTNAARAAKDGYGLVLPFSDVTEETLSGKVNELLFNPKYRTTAKFRSKIFHDQQIKPMDRAIYWIEYIARHGKADHLKVQALKLPWYKYHLLDVISFTILLIVVFNIILISLIKKMCFRKKLKLKRN